MKRIVLAYSGGLETSVAIPWLSERFGAEVIAVTLDLGQGRELTDIRERALSAGARRAHVLDVRDEFAREYILPSLQADALDEDVAPLADALARPLIAKTLVEVARMEGADAIAHGFAGEASDPSGLGVAVGALAPDIEVIVPARLWDLTHDDLVEYARRRAIAVPETADAPYDVDANLWGRSIQGGALAGAPLPEEAFALTRARQTSPDEPALVEIEFDRGVPVRANGIDMPLVELIESLETIAGAHGVGRIDTIGHAADGVGSRQVYEAPAAVVLHAAHRALQALVVPRDLERLSRELGRTYAGLVYNGQWFSPTREAIDGFVAAVQPRVSGVVRLKLFKGDCRVETIARRREANAEQPVGR